MDRLSFSIFNFQLLHGGHVGKEVEYFIRVAPFVVVP